MIIPSASNIFDFDWYERDNTIIAGETSYSSFLLKEELATKLVGSNPLVDPLKVSLFLTAFSRIISSGKRVFINEKSDESYTDGEKIMVSSLNKWKDSENTAWWKIDTMIGLTLHEACHCRYSNFSELRKSNLSKTEQWLSNVIEDEAIENSMRNFRKGYGKFFDNVKATQLGFDSFEISDDDNEIQTIMNILFAVIRMPNFISEHLSDDNKKKFGSLFFEIYNVLNLNDCLIKPKDNKTVCNTKKNIDAAKKICSLIKEFCNIDDDKLDETKKQQSSPSDGSNSGNSVSGNEDEKNNENEKSESEKQKELQELLDELSEEFGMTLDEMIEDSEQAKDKELTDIMNSACRMESTSWKKGGKAEIDNKKQFNKYYSNVYPYISKVANALSPKSSKLNYKTSRYQLSGQLDGTCIASAFMGGRFTNKVVREVKEKERKKLALCLIVDNSGSMSQGKTADKAGMFATLFAEAVHSLPGFELYVYSHDDTLINVCDSSNYNKNRFKIGNINTNNVGGGQNEVASYNAAVTEVRKNTKLPICMINFTDSEYCSHIEDIKTTVDNLKKKQDCQTTLVCLNERDRNKYNEYIYGENNYINIHNINPVAMQEVIKKLTKIISKMYK